MSSPTPARRPTGRAVTLLLATILIATLATALWVAIGAVDHTPVHIHIDGEEVVSGLDLAALPTGERVLLVAGLLVALLAAFVVIPIALLMALLGVILGVLAVVGLPLLAVLAVAALLLSPLALIVWLLWLALRPAPNIGWMSTDTDPAAAPRAVLADDERLMREQLRARLAEVWPELQIVAEAKNGQEAVDLVAEHRPDIVFLDIRMPGLTGVEAARRIAQMELDPDDLLPEIVFITAYDQYAVEAFEQGVVDYVLKPAERERLALTVARLRERLARRGTPDETGSAPMQQLLHQLAARLDPGSATKPLQWIQASVGNAIQMIPVDEVLFFISDEKYTRVQTAQVEALIRKPIKELVDELDPQTFWQIHRSTLVNVKAIADVSRDFRGRQIVTVKGHGEKLEVSRSYTGLFKGM